MQDNISKIKDRLGIVEVISGYLKLQKAGANFKTPCPFHNEKTPSFFISPERQIWHCFGCQKGGDIFTFVKEIEGVEFPEALRILAAKAGVELEEFDSSVKDSKDSLYQICETAARFFEKQLSSSDTGKSVLEYLKDRGLELETISKFRLGFAPNTWNGLTGYLRSSGFSEKEITDAGMAIKKQQGSGIYDRFRSRIMFPVSDANGRVVGFSGRIFEGDEKEAKYINTPQTLIYDKSRVLYGLNHSRSEIRRKDRCVLVEGNMDAVMSFQAGVTNVAASSGTALASTHLAILKRFTNNLDFCFDTDSAGAMATRRGIGAALGQSFNIKVVSIDDKECKDPADYVKKYGKEWEKKVSLAKPVMEFYFDKAKEGYNPESAESKNKVILTVAPFVRRLSGRVERAHWIDRLAHLLRTREDAVEADIMSAPDDLYVYESGQVNPDAQRPTIQTAVKKEEMDILNEALLSLMIKNPALFKQEAADIDKSILNPLTSNIIGELVKENLDQFDFNNFVKKFDPGVKLDLEFAYLRSQALWDNFQDEELKTEFTGILNKLKKKDVNLRLASLQHEMKAAEAASDKAKLANLAEEFSKLTQRLVEIHKT